MKITMKSTRRGSQDGFKIESFIEGKEYTVADSLGAYFIRQRWADIIQDESETTIEDDVSELALRCEYQLEFEKGYYPPSFDRWKIERQNKLAALVSEVDVLEAL